MKNNQILGALALDLKRVAMGYFRGSDVMAERFYEEALKRRKQLDNKNLKPYLVNFLNKLDNFKTQDKTKVTEDALLYSTIFQNAAMTPDDSCPT
ncbi:MAG: hypothetical protein A2W22_03415 [Candidatus Levybacteria bacterium RBG_16_35_11]|nr:MAG: hypothetical protein A2W22_03415 [Candidatus Levybacteria bacterium RBG_16_35_11]